MDQQQVVPSDTSKRATEQNRRTIRAYEGYAQTYAEVVGDEPFPQSLAAMREMVLALGGSGTVLEIGSGTGNDADFLDRAGLTVHRTDATDAFLAMQRQRGKEVERLNVIEDPLGGPWDAVQALCVLIHVDRSLLDGVIAKMRDATRPGGYLLISMREGVGVEVNGDWHTTLWPTAELEAHYAEAGLAVRWRSFDGGAEDERWVTHLLRRT